MKKLFFLLTSAILIISCSNDDESISLVEEPVESNIYIKKMTNVSLAESDGSLDTFTMEFEYNDDKKITKIITNNGYVNHLIYENNRLVKYGSYLGTDLQSDGEIHYANDKVDFTIARDGDYVFRIDYKYSIDGKLKRIQQCSGTEPCPDNDRYNEFTFQNDNIVQEVNSMVVFGEPFVITYNYTYEDQKNPFTNYDEATRLLLKDMANAALSKNNYTQQTDYAGELVTYVNTYTEEGYLKSQEGRYETTNDLYVSFEYEYTKL